MTIFRFNLQREVIEANFELQFIILLFGLDWIYEIDTRLLGQAELGFIGFFIDEHVGTLIVEVKVIKIASFIAPKTLILNLRWVKVRNQTVIELMPGALLIFDVRDIVSELGHPDMDHYSN